MTVDDESIIRFRRAIQALAGDRSRKSAVHRIVPQEVSEVVCGNEVIDRNNFEFGSYPPLLVQGSKNQATDPAKAVDCDFQCHMSGAMDDSTDFLDYWKGRKESNTQCDRIMHGKRIS